VGDIFRRFGDAFCPTSSLSLQQRRVLLDIQRCRTPALGGHLEQCSTCGYSRIRLNSCRNRHCPTCQNLAQKAWLEQRVERLLPVPYFHVVFTLPALLRPLALSHRCLLFNLLFASASATLLAFSNDPRFLGAQLGLTAVLHTWSRTLEFHPHLHCIVTAGGLSHDGSRWVSCSPRFLFPVLALSRVFAGKFLAGLEKLFHAGQLTGIQPPAFAALLASLRAIDWVVYAKRPFGGAKALYSYLGRYTHRTGISNQRLLSFTDHAVIFRTRGNKTCTLTPTEFIRRFLQHVLPQGFVKIRHYGLLASCHVGGRLEQARRLLAPAPPSPAPSSAAPSSAAPSSAAPSSAAPSSSDLDPASSAFLCPRCQRGVMCGVAPLRDLARALVAFFRHLAILAGADTS